MIHRICDTTQLQNVISSSEYVIVLFCGSRSLTCRIVEWIFGILEAEHSREGYLAYASISMEILPHVVEDYGVAALPAFLVIHDGKQLERPLGRNGPVLCADPYGLRETSLRLAAEVARKIQREIERKQAEITRVEVMRAEAKRAEAAERAEEAMRAAAERAIAEDRAEAERAEAAERAQTAESADGGMEADGSADGGN